MKIIAFCTILGFAVIFIQCFSPESTETIYELDEDRSVIEWKGYLKKGGYRQGTIGMHGEYIMVSDQKLISGSFLFPLLSLTNTDLSTNEQKQQLIKQLQSSDFFHMVLYPEIKFEISKVEDYGNADDPDTSLNYIVSGDLIILGKARPISFPAKINIENNSLAGEGKLVLDFTEWGMVYAADTTSLTRQHVKPNIDLTIKIYARQL